MTQSPFAGLAVLSLIVSEAATAQENPTDIVATAVRDQGYTCDNPQTATPDPENSAPDEKAWTIRCGDNSYRVTFRGDTGAEVVPLAE